MISDALSVRLADMLSKEFGNDNLDIHLTRIKEMLKRRQLITVYELGTGSEKSDIDSAILHALLKGKTLDTPRVLEIKIRDFIYIFYVLFNS